MPTIDIPLSALPRELQKTFKKIHKALQKGRWKGAKKGAVVLAKNAPIAFGNLSDSVSAVDFAAIDESSILVEAPHAASVEAGARPHTPPLEPLVAWVKLKGMQGLSKSGRLRSSRVGRSGFTPAAVSRMKARFVAQSLRRYQQDGAMDINAPEKVAAAIQHYISEHGIRPTHFARRSLPSIAAKVLEAIADELNNAFSEASSDVGGSNLLPETTLLLPP